MVNFTIRLLLGTIVYLVYLCAVVGSTGLHLADLTQLRGGQETRLELQQLGGTSWWRPNLWQVCNINMDKLDNNNNFSTGQGRKVCPCPDLCWL